MTATSPIQNVIIAMNALYQPKDLTGARFQLALQTADAARDAGYRLIVVDSSPGSAVQDELEDRGATVYRAYNKVMTMGEQKRYAVYQALETFKRENTVPLADRVVICMEPEKTGIIAAIAAIVAPILAGDAALVVPSRTAEGWASYPDFQIESEQRGIKAVGDITGRPDLDVFFGPVAMNVAAAQLLLTADPQAEGIVDKYEQLTVIPRALGAGLRVASVPVDFTYPPAQQAEEQGPLRETMLAKRLAQEKENVLAMTTVYTNAVAARSASPGEVIT